ncbi:MAG: HAD family hydrolase [Candidatus Hodarchaeota archaeon]
MSIKKQLSKIDLIIFDFDGTLFQGKKFSLPIFRKCLKKAYKKFQLDKEYPSDEVILSQFGKQVEDIYNDIFGSNKIEVIEYFSNCVEIAEVKSFKEGKGEFFPDVEKTLSILKKHGYKLAICTNAPKYYWEEATKIFQLGKFFDLMMAAGLYPGRDKIWMVHNIVNKLNSKHFMVVGDRHHDIAAAKANNGISVGCSYGYGAKEVEKADIIISEIKELLSVLSIHIS